MAGYDHNFSETELTGEADVTWVDSIQPGAHLLPGLPTVSLELTNQPSCFLGGYCACLPKGHRSTLPAKTELTSYKVDPPVFPLQPDILWWFVSFFKFCISDHSFQCHLHDEWQQARLSNVACRTVGISDET